MGRRGGRKRKDESKENFLLKLNHENILQRIYAICHFYFESKENSNFEGNINALGAVMSIVELLSKQDPNGQFICLNCLTPAIPGRMVYINKAALEHHMATERKRMITTYSMEFESSQTTTSATNLVEQTAYLVKALDSFDGLFKQQWHWFMPVKRKDVMNMIKKAELVLEGISPVRNPVGLSTPNRKKYRKLYDRLKAINKELVILFEHCLIVTNIDFEQEEMKFRQMEMENRKMALMEDLKLK